MKPTKNVLQETEKKDPINRPTDSNYSVQIDYGLNIK